MTFWLFARLFESPELYWSFDELCYNEAPLRRPFLKILYENTDKNKNKSDAEITKTFKLSNKIICKPPQSLETIPLINGAIDKTGFADYMANSSHKVMKTWAWSRLCGSRVEVRSTHVSEFCSVSWWSVRRGRLA